MYNVIWANQKTDFFKHQWLRTLVMFDVMNFPAILLGIKRHFKFCWYINFTLFLVLFQIFSIYDNFLCYRF